MNATLIAMLVSVMWTPSGNAVTDNYTLQGFTTVEACRDAEAPVKAQVAKMYPEGAVVIARCISAYKGSAGKAGAAH